MGFKIKVFLTFFIIAKIILGALLNIICNILIPYFFSPITIYNFKFYINVLR